jgi:hypothetical protein
MGRVAPAPTRVTLLRMRCAVFALALACTMCLPGAAAPERPACADEALAVILADCRSLVRAAVTATDKARQRKSCLERVDAWERCQ